MSLQTHQDTNYDTRDEWPSVNAKQVSTHKNWADADAWMKDDKASRVVEGVQMGPNLGGHHKQVEWERVDKSKPFGFGKGGGTGLAG